ncbi:MAG: hypothetical protein R2941_13175 [Desulfobacterales bacterium]
MWSVQEYRFQGWLRTVYEKYDSDYILLLNPDARLLPRLLKMQKTR